MKVIIAGSRTFNNYEILLKACDFYLKKTTDIEIVSGGAKGADELGERYAEERGYLIKRFPADWNKHGKSAGYIRNGLMAHYSDALIAFWDGKSKGTKNMIEQAKKNNLNIKIFNYANT